MNAPMLLPGDPVPFFVARTAVNPNFHFDTVGGHYLVVSFFASAERPEIRKVLEQFHQLTDLFDDIQMSFFGVSCDPQDEASGRVRDRIPGYRYFWDFDFKVSRLYHVCREIERDGKKMTAYQLCTYIISPRMQVLGVVSFEPVDKHVETVAGFLRRLPKLPPPAPAGPNAPVLMVPHVFEPDFCRKLIQIYESEGGYESGFMIQKDGKTYASMDYSHKRRRDCTINDRAVQLEIRSRLERRLLPEIRKAFQFHTKYIERYIVACYDANEGGHFRAHRDNTTSGTAHRRFAVSINLNAEEFVGGDLRFPEFGTQLYRPPTGGACVFSCSLLHEATPVRQGKRYACLPFLYDEWGEQVRKRNLNSIVTAPPSETPASAESSSSDANEEANTAAER